MKVSQKTKIELSYDSANPTTEYNLEEDENRNSKRILNLKIHCSIIHDNQDMERTYESTTDEWIRAMQYA